MKNENGFYTLPFYKKILYKIKERILGIKINYFKLAILLFIILACLGTWALATFNKIDVKPRLPFDKTGFIDKTQFNKSEILISNDRFEFKLNTNTTHFTIYDNETNQTWSSRPNGNQEVPVDALELFTLYYEQTIEGPKGMSVYDESIKHKAYAFRESEQSIEILYTVGGKHELTIDDLPRKIPKDKFELRIIPTLKEVALNDSKIRRNLKFFEAQYVLVENDDYYFLRELDSSDGLQIIHDLLFKYSGYTNEDFIEDNKKYGFDTAKETPNFEFVVKYTLTEAGLDFKLINDSIVETSQYPLAYIDILPYFGCGNIDTEGYTIIPDGSGVLINHNNNKYKRLPYNKRIYGLDHAITSTNKYMPEEQEDITMPLYGVNIDGASFIHLIDEGAAMTTINSGFKTEYSNSVLKHKFPYTHYRYFIRERDAYIFTGIGSNQNVTVWTKQYNKEDFSSKLMFTSGEDQSYVEMAKMYQSYLIQKGILYQGNDLTDMGTFNLMLLGGYKTIDHILGIPYEKVESLTNTKQAKEIVDLLLQANIQNINLSYQGWANEGIKPTYMSSIDFDKVVGNENDFKQLKNYLNTQDVSFVPEIYVNTAYTDKGLKLKKDGIYNMFWEMIQRYSFDKATLIPDRTTMPIYTINSDNSMEYMRKISKQFNEIGFDSIGFIDFGNELNSSFHRKNVVFKNDSVNHFLQSMIESTSDYNQIMIRNPYLFAYPYMTYALDVPTTGTNYQIIDQSIPFVQLVLSGTMDYSGKAINIDDNKSLQWHKLKAIETGSNLNFTWSYEDTVPLTQTEYSEFYSTYYKNWVDLAVDTYHELNDLGIYSSQLINHKFITNDGSVVEVTYANGIKIQIDYNQMSYVTVNGVVM